MASLKQVEDAIFAKEGFRVKLTPLVEKKSISLPPYDYEYMASNKWKLTDWRMVRMARYIPFLKAVDVLRGDGTKTVSDMRLGNLRDTYFAEFCADEITELEGGDVAATRTPRDRAPDHSGSHGGRHDDGRTRRRRQ